MSKKKLSMQSGKGRWAGELGFLNRDVNPNGNMRKGIVIQAVRGAIQESIHQGYDMIDYDVIEEQLDLLIAGK